MAIAMSKTRQEFPLSTKKVLKKTIASLLILAIIVFIFYIILAVVAASQGGLLGFTIISVIILGLFFLISLPIYLYQRWYYDVYFYDLTPDYIVIRKGPITPSEITIPYERVQDVYVDQDILDRMFGLYDVHLSSATISSGMEAHIDGVEKPAADGLRALLLQTVSQKISKNVKLSPPPPPPNTTQ